MNERERSIFIQGIKVGVQMQKEDHTLETAEAPIVKAVPGAKYQAYITKSGKKAWRPKDRVAGQFGRPKKVITRRRWTADEDIVIIDHREMGNIELATMIPNRDAKGISQRKAYLKVNRWQVMAKPLMKDREDDDLARLNQ